MLKIAKCSARLSKLREGGKRKVFARDPSFGCNCVPKPLDLKYSPITAVLQVAQRIQKRKLGSVLGDLATVIQTMKNAILTNQKTTLLLNGWPRTIAETMATATKFMKFS